MIAMLLVKNTNVGFSIIRLDLSTYSLTLYVLAAVLDPWG